MRPLRVTGNPRRRTPLRGPKHVSTKLAQEGITMRKLFLVALCSIPLLSVARAAEHKMKSGDSMQQGDAMKSSETTQGDAMKQGDGTGYGGSGSMEQDSTKTSGAESKMQDDGMKQGGSMAHDDKMDSGKVK